MIPICFFVRSVLIMAYAVLFALSAIVPVNAGEAPDRLVLAHYMACCSRSGPAASVYEYRAEMLQARTEGIDGFSINFGSIKKHPSHLLVIERMYQAAEALPDFHLLLSFDQTPADEAVEVIQCYAVRPNTLRKEGRVVVSGWGQTREWATEVRRRLEEGGLPIFLIPHMNYPLRSHLVRFITDLPDTYVARTVLDELPTLDGFFSFGAGGPYREMATAIRQIAPMMHAHHKLYMAGIAPFYRGLGNNSRVFESDGFVGMRDRWQAAISAGVDWIQLVTWNDWNESSYLQPFESSSLDISYNPAWHGILDHSGFLRASRYYIEWFKSGHAPSIDTDRVFYFYQLHKRTAEGEVGFAPIVLGRPRFWEQLTDNFHLATFLTAPAIAVIHIGSEVHTVQLQEGSSVASVPLSLGPVAVEIHRGDRQIANAILPFPIALTATIGNFNYLAGEVPFRLQSGSTPIRPRSAE